jgi:hypothetical protein
LIGGFNLNRHSDVRLKPVTAITTGVRTKIGIKFSTIFPKNSHQSEVSAIP